MVCSSSASKANGQQLARSREPSSGWDNGDIQYRSWEQLALALRWGAERVQPWWSVSKIILDHVLQPLVSAMI